MFFHHHTIRKYTTALLDVFNDLEVPRYNEDGTLIKAINVPIFFSSRERAIQLTEQQYAENNGMQNILPKMALSLDSMNKANSRDTNKNKKINLRANDNNTVSFQLNSVSYDFSFTLHIMTRTMTDLTTIVEQILPQFRPTMNIRVREFDFSDTLETLPISMDGVSFDFPDEMGEDDGIRILTAEINITLRGNIHLPVKDNVNTISTVIATLYGPTDNKIARSTATAFDNDTIEYSGADAEAEGEV